MPPSRRATGNPIVLLVQPQDDGRSAYESYLTDKGFAIVVASDISTALDLAPSADVVVTGIRVQGAADGLYLVRRLRSDRRTHAMPLVIFSAYTTLEDRRAAHAAGCDLFLPKSCRPDELATRLRQVIARRQSTRA